MIFPDAPIARRLFARAALPCLCAVLLAGAGEVLADQVVVEGVSYPGASILGLEEGRLRFLTASDALQTPWISDVDWMIVDRGVAYADLNEAELYVSHDDPDRAIERYRRALRTSDPAWAELIQARLLAACSRAGRLEQATDVFIRVVGGEQSGTAAAARLMPDIPIRKGNTAAGNAIKGLDDAIKKADNEDHKAMYRLLRFDVLRLTGDDRAAAAVASIVALRVPLNARSARVYQIKLAALTMVPDEAVDDAWFDAVDRAIRLAPESDLSGFLMLKGRALLKRASTREDLIRASWPFMRVVIHLHGEDAAAEALYETALILERLGQPRKAARLLHECLDHAGCDEHLRALADEAMARVGSSGARD